AIYEDHQGKVHLVTSDGLCLAEDRGLKCDGPKELQPILAGQDISHVLEDREGNVWIGSNDGLFRFKEAQIKSYGAEEGLADGPFQAITEDERGGVWLGAVSFDRSGKLPGIFHFSQGRFQPFQFRPNALALL